MRILLVQPGKPLRAMGMPCLVAPLGLLMVASSVPNHTCRVFDMRLEEDGAFERTLVRFRPYIVCLTALSVEAEVTKALAQRAKCVLPEATVVWGGYHATLATEDALSEPGVDIVVCGEGEKTFPELVEAIARGGPYDGVAGITFRRDGEIVRTPPRPLIKSLDTLPFPPWELVSRYWPHYHLGLMGGPAGLVETSRGCPNRCIFCSVPKFHGGKYRVKSPARVIAELKRLPRQIRFVAFVDDNFFAGRRRALEIARQISNLNRRHWRGERWRYWAQASPRDIAEQPSLVEQWSGIGLNMLLVGIESLDEEEVVRHGKRATVVQAREALEIMRGYGVEAWACFIVDPKTWGEENFDALKEFLLQEKVAVLQLTFLTALPGTELSRRLLARGLRPSQVFPLADFLHLPRGLRTRLGRKRLFERMAEMYRATGLHSLESYHRLVRAGVIDRGWLRSEAGRQAMMVFAQLCDWKEYVKAHRLVRT